MSGCTAWSAVAGSSCFWELLLRDRRWLHGQAGTFAQLSALVAAPIGIDAATRLARRQVYRWSSASRRRRESHPTMRRRWTIVGPIIVPIVLIWPYIQMRHCRNLRRSTSGNRFSPGCSNRSSRCGPLAPSRLSPNVDNVLPSGRVIGFSKCRDHSVLVQP